MSPVVARVELLYGSQSPLKPLIVPDGAVEGQTSSPLRPPSGRYGVYAPTSSEASSSSDESPSPDSHDSDVEEISGPAIRQHPWHEETSDSIFNNQGHSWKGILGDFPFPHPQDDREAVCNVGFDAYSNDVFEEDVDNSENSQFSRSTSPMELSSSPEPADPPAAENKASSMAAGEPVVVGAWPRSRSPSIFSSSFPPTRIVVPVEKCVAATPIVNEPQSSDETDDVWPAPNAANVPVVDSVVVENVEADTPAESSETLQINASLATLKVHSLSKCCLLY